MRLFKRNTGKSGEQNQTVLPRHIAVIMDGNGRWAKKRGLPRSAGHAAGSETFRRVANYCRDIGVLYLTVFAFSTENWKRPEEEVRAIMSLLEKYLTEAVENMARDKIKIRIFGDLAPLGPKLRALAERAMKLSEEIDGIQLNICLNYGGRAEIVRAAKLFAEACAEGKASPESLTEEGFSGLLWSVGIPDPDLVIRPSGEIRLSNFLLWQAAYAELVFTDTLWPDFGADDIDRAVAEYGSRSRRYGAV